MWRFFLIVLLLIPLPSLAKTWTTINGKVWEERIIGRTLSGVLITEFIEVWGVIKKAEAKEESLEDTIKNFIRAMSDIQGIDGEFMTRLAGCESGFNPQAIGDKGKAKGLYQWWLKSWNHYNKIYKTELDRESWVDQVKMSVKVVDDYGTDDWYNCSYWIKNGKWPK